MIISEWLMVIITAIYSFVTILIFIANKESVSEMKLSRNLAYRPEIIAFFYEEKGGLYFQIKNIGSRAAFDINVKIDPIFNIYTYTGENNFMTIHSGPGHKTYEEKKIKIFAPNQQLETFVGIQHKIINQYENSIEISKQNEDSLDSKIELSYYDYERKNHFKESYDVTLLDFQKHNGIKINGIHEGVKELNELNKNLLKIKNDLNKSIK